MINPPGCQIWVDSYMFVHHNMQWTGKCPDGRADGKGTLTAVWSPPIDSYSYADSLGHRGRFIKDRPHGEWDIRWYENMQLRRPNAVWSDDFLVLKGRYEYGKKHGKWTTRNRQFYGDSRTRRFQGNTGEYSQGLRVGEWLYGRRTACESVTYRVGARLESRRVDSVNCQQKLSNVEGFHWSKYGRR